MRDAVAYWRLTPVTVSEVEARKTAAPVFCLATAELVHGRGGPDDKAVSKRVYNTLARMELIPALVDGERYYLMQAHLSEIKKLASKSSTPEEWEEVRELIVKLAEIAFDH